MRLYIISSFRWNLIFILLLDRSDFTVTFGNKMVSIFYKSKTIGTRILIDGLYKLNLHTSYFESLYVNNLDIKWTLIKKTLTAYGINV